MNGRRARIVAAVIMVALLVASCSSDSDSRLTKAQYIARADRICQAANSKSAALGTPSVSDPQALARYLQKSGQIISGAVAQLKKLNPPKADEAKLNKLVDGLQKSAGLFPALVTAVKSQNTQEIQKVASRLKQASLQGAQIARDYGFKVCAHSAGTSATPAP